MIRSSGFAHDNETTKGIWNSRLVILTSVDEKLRDIHSVISFYGRISCNIFNGLIMVAVWRLNYSTGTVEINSEIIGKRDWNCIRRLKLNKTEFDWGWEKF